MRNQSTSFVLMPRAGGMAWCWHRMTMGLKQAQRESIAVDLPGDDASASLSDYADLVLRAIGKRERVILVTVAGGFTAPLVCARAAARMLVFVNAMVPLPGETAGAWWGNTGAAQARMAAAVRGGYSTKFDVQTYFLHDVPQAGLRAAAAPPREQTDAIFQYPCDFTGWSGIPIRVIAAANDRFFPVEFQRRVARERLVVDVGIVPGCHLVALSHPGELVGRLLRFEREA